MEIAHDPLQPGRLDGCDCPGTPALAEDRAGNLVPRDAEVAFSIIDVKVKALAEANNRFARSVFDRIAEGDGNVVFSPYSIHAAIAMTMEGMDGATRSQTHTALTPHPTPKPLTQACQRSGDQAEHARGDRD